MRLRYTSGAGEHLVLAARVADRWRMAIGGAEYLVDIILQDSNQLALELDSRRIERFLLASEADGLLISWHGAGYRLARAAGLSVDALGERARRQHGHASLEAPMPGTVIKVLVEEGQPVAERQPLVVLEAMKMEHVVVAPYDGVIRKLSFRAGALVAKGAALVELDQRDDL